MIQRKQTLFLIIALVLDIVCLCLPIGRLHFQGMEADALMTNLWIQMADGSRQFTVWYLFVLLLLACPVTLWAIFSYKNRLFQMRLCLLCMLLTALWYAGFCAVKFILAPEMAADVQPAVAFVLPFVSLVFYYLARRGVKADEALVRSMDRIR